VDVLDDADDLARMSRVCALLVIVTLSALLWSALLGIGVAAWALLGSGATIGPTNAA